MGLYSKAKKLIELQNERIASLPDVTPAFGTTRRKTRSARHDPAEIESLVKKIDSSTDSKGSFFIISIVLDDFVAGIDPAHVPNEKGEIDSEINLHINTYIKNIAHSFMFGDSVIIIVIPQPDSIDPELFIHQVYLSLKKTFHARNDQQYTVLDALIRNYPNDGTDLRELVEHIV